MNNSKIILSILGAAAVGYLVADYLTSESGNSVAEKIRDNAGNWLQKIQDTASNVANGATPEQHAEFNQANEVPGQA